MQSHTGEKIEQQGRYQFEECGITLDVRIEDHIVQFTLSDPTGTTLYTSGRPSMSSIHRWAMVMDDSCALWVNSSDIGLYRLTRSPQSNVFELKVATNPPASAVL